MSDIDPFSVTAIERQWIPVLRGIEPMDPNDDDPGHFDTLFVQMRNHVLSCFHKNIHQYLTLETAREEIPDELHFLLPPIIELLTRFGYINTGCIRSPPPDHVPPPEGIAPQLRQRGKKVVVVGAGYSGVTAARQLHTMGFDVTLLEASPRIGGRTRTSTTTRGDLGASIVTGIIGNPVTTFLRQLPSSPGQVAEVHKLRTACPIADDSGNPLSEADDNAAERSFNEILEESKSIRDETQSLGRAIDILLERRQAGPNPLSPLALQGFWWHVANLEYGCASPLSAISLVHWDQDDGNEYRGPHCVLRGGYQPLAEILAKGLPDVRLETPVAAIDYNALRSDGSTGCRVETLAGDAIECDAVLCTVSLGVLQDSVSNQQAKMGSQSGGGVFPQDERGLINFSPLLPDWKTSSMQANLGIGVLNKVMLEFHEAFWKDEDAGRRLGAARNFFADWTGQIYSGPNPGSATGTRARGIGYMYWNLESVTGAPALTVLLAGDAAHLVEREDDPDSHAHSSSDAVDDHCVRILPEQLPARDIGDANDAASLSDAQVVATVLSRLQTLMAIPSDRTDDYMANFKCATVTHWRSNPFTRGTYCYLTPSGKGEDHSTLARGVSGVPGQPPRLFFAGEATSRDHPSTVAGATAQGLRAAGEIACNLEGPIGGSLFPALTFDRIRVLAQERRMQFGDEKVQKRSSRGRLRALRQNRKRLYSSIGYDSDDLDDSNSTLEKIHSDLAALPTVSFKRVKGEHGSIQSGFRPQELYTHERVSVASNHSVAEPPRPRVISLNEVRASDSAQPRFRTAADYYENRRRMMGLGSAGPGPVPAGRGLAPQLQPQQSVQPGTFSTPGMTAAQQLSATLSRLQHSSVARGGRAAPAPSQKSRTNFDKMNFEELVKRFPRGDVTQFKASASALVVKLLQQNYARTHRSKPSEADKQEFRHNARKLTHSIVKKELKSVLEKHEQRGDTAPPVLRMVPRTEEKIGAYVATFAK